HQAVRQHQPLVFELRRPDRRVQRHIPDRDGGGDDEQQEQGQSFHFFCFSLFVFRSSFLSSSALSRSSRARNCLRISGSLRNTADDRRHSLLAIAGYPEMNSSASTELVMPV